MIKMADTALLLTRPDLSREKEMVRDVVHLYYDINSLRISYDDMPNILWYRTVDLLQDFPHLLGYYYSLVEHLKEVSPFLKLLHKYNPDFYKEEFFRGRKNWRNWRKEE
jgi:hypothetical protein